MAEDQLLIIANKFSGKIREALINSYREFLGRVTEDVIIAAYKRNGVMGLVELALSLEGELAKNVAPVLYDAWVQSGRIGISSLPSGSTTGIVIFDTLPVGAISAAEAFRLALVSNITETTRETVTQAISYSIAAGRNPRQTAYDFRAAIGLTPSQLDVVQNYRRLLEEASPEALDRTLRDARSDRSVARAVESGISLDSDQIDSLTERYRQRMVKWRAETIARTESLRAINMGEYESILAAHKAGKISPYLKRFWIVSNDERVRRHHLDIPQLNSLGVGIEESFQTPLGPLRYPLDPEGAARNVINCRCRVRYSIVRT